MASSHLQSSSSATSTFFSQEDFSVVEEDTPAQQHYYERHQGRRRQLQANNPLYEPPSENNNTFVMNDHPSVWNNTSVAPTIAPTTAPEQQPPMDPLNMALTIALPFFLLFTVALCSRSNVPGREHWNGARIAENARRIREQRRIKSQRKALTPEERSLQIHTSMRCMTVVGKDSRTGYLKLSEDGKLMADATAKTASSTTSTSDSIFAQSNNKPDPPVENDKENPVLEDDFQIIRSKGSTDTADTAPADDSPPNSLNGIEGVMKNDNQEEENVCYICLDNFEVGDQVMWSRLHKRCDNETCNKDDPSKHGCRHVFHQECIMPWLLEKRENECPSCRAPFIVDAPPPEEEKPQLTLEEESDLVLAQLGRNGTIEVPMGSEDRVRNGNRSSSQPVDVEAMVESIDGKDDDNDDEMEIEEGYSFVIDKGLIKAIPNFHGTLAVPVPFRTQNPTCPVP